MVPVTHQAVVLVSSSGYSHDHQSLLRKLLDERIELFCAIGKDCEAWEAAMDWLCINLDTSGVLPGAFVVTTSHPDESLEDVVEFAQNWNSHEEQTTDVRIVEV